MGQQAFEVVLVHERDALPEVRAVLAVMVVMVGGQSQQVVGGYAQGLGGSGQGAGGHAGFALLRPAEDAAVAVVPDGLRQLFLGHLPGQPGVSQSLSEQAVRLAVHDFALLWAGVEGLLGWSRRRARP